MKSKREMTNIETADDYHVAARRHAKSDRVNGALHPNDKGRIAVFWSRGYYWDLTADGRYTLQPLARA